MTNGPTNLIDFVASQQKQNHDLAEAKSKLKRYDAMTAIRSGFFAICMLAFIFIAIAGTIALISKIIQWGF